jgi:hypothetical protein
MTRDFGHCSFCEAPIGSLAAAGCLATDCPVRAARAAVEDEPRNCPEGTGCDGGGWECYGLGYADPHFRECRKCGNPEGHMSP